MTDSDNGAVGVEDEASKENVTIENFRGKAIANNYEEARRSIELYEIAATTKVYCYKKNKAFLNECMVP